MITIKEYLKNKNGITYNKLYGLCYRNNINPVKEENNKHYKVHYYNANDLDKAVEISKTNAILKR